MVAVGKAVFRQIKMDFQLKPGCIPQSGSVLLPGVADCLLLAVRHGIPGSLQRGFTHRPPLHIPGAICTFQPNAQVRGIEHNSALIRQGIEWLPLCRKPQRTPQAAGGIGQRRNRCINTP